MHFNVCELLYWVSTAFVLTAAVECQQDPNYVTIDVHVNAYYERVVKVDLSTMESIRISAKTFSDFLIALTQNQDDYNANTMYSIGIGGSFNTKSSMQRGGTFWVVDNTTNRLNANAFNTFWLSWSKGVIRVGTGSTVGQNTFMFYTDPQPLKVNFLAFSCWNHKCDAKVTYPVSVRQLTGHFHRYPRYRLDGATTCSSGMTEARSRTECCALCQTIVGCNSVNFRRNPRSSSGKQTCIPMTSTLPIGVNQQLISDDDWEWLYVEV